MRDKNNDNRNEAIFDEISEFITQACYEIDSESRVRRKSQRIESSAGVAATRIKSRIIIGTSTYTYVQHVPGSGRRPITVRPARILFLRNHNSNSRYRIELHGDCYGRRLDERGTRCGKGAAFDQRHPLLERVYRMGLMPDTWSMKSNIWTEEIEGSIRRYVHRYFL